MKHDTAADCRLRTAEKLIMENICHEEMGVSLLLKL